MTSRTTEEVGPENVTSIFGTLDADNAAIYDKYRNDFGYTSQEALRATPAAKIMTKLGYPNVQFDKSGQAVGTKGPWRWELRLRAAHAVTMR